MQTISFFSSTRNPGRYIAMHSSFVIEFRIRRASRPSFIERLLRRGAPLLLATARFPDLLEHRFLRMGVVPPGARHARGHGAVVEVRFHADAKGLEVCEQRHGYLLSAAIVSSSARCSMPGARFGVPK